MEFQIRMMGERSQDERNLLKKIVIFQLTTYLKKLTDIKLRGRDKRTNNPDEYVNKSAMNVMDGVSNSHDGRKKSRRKKFIKKNRDISIDDLFKKIKAGSRLDLAKGITLLESIA